MGPRGFAIKNEARFRTRVTSPISCSNITNAKVLHVVKSSMGFVESPLEKFCGDSANVPNGPKDWIRTQCTIGTIGHNAGSAHVLPVQASF